jgi:hypothetical protein
MHPRIYPRMHEGMNYKCTIQNVDLWTRINYSSFVLLKYMKYTLIKPFLINQRSIPYNQYWERYELLNFKSLNYCKIGHFLIFLSNDSREIHILCSCQAAFYEVILFPYNQ